MNMARARNIKPGFFKNYDLADLGPQIQLLFAGLWCLADREGRLENKPRLIKAEIFPYYDVDVNDGLTQLERCGFVKLYKSNGNSCLQIVNFKKHQSPHNTEKASILEPDSPLETITSDNNESLTLDSRNHNDGNIPDSLIPDTGFTDLPKPDSLNLIPDSATAEREKWFDQFWSDYPNKAAKQDAVKAWKKLKPDKATFDAIIAAVAQQKNWPSWKTGYTPHPATWLNGQRWNDEPPANVAQQQTRQPNNRQNVDLSKIDYSHGLTENDDGSYKLN